MEIDVLINSCARTDILEISIKTFKEMISTDAHSFRYVILEDKVENVDRQAQGRKWIESNIDMFDEVVFSEKRLGPGYFFGPVVKLCKSDYFFHLEDDNAFIKKVNIDPLIDVLSANQDIVEILLSRGDPDSVHKLSTTIINNLELTEYKIFSVATGVFNTKLVCNMIDKAGWENRLHEGALMTPISKELSYKKFLLGKSDKHYNHLSALYGYGKGGWRK